MDLKIIYVIFKKKRNNGKTGGSLKALYERELRNRSFGEDDIKFVLNLITEMDIDPRLNRIDNDAFQKIKERGPELEKAFNEINEKYNISWTHNNEPEK